MKCIFFVLIFFLFRDFLLILPRRGYLLGSTFSHLLGVRNKLMRQQPLGERQLQNG